MSESNVLKKIVVFSGYENDERGTPRPYKYYVILASRSSRYSGHYNISASGFSVDTELKDDFIDIIDATSLEQALDAALNRLKGSESFQDLRVEEADAPDFGPL